jgi:hypothetical protein
LKKLPEPTENAGVRIAHGAVVARKKVTEVHLIEYIKFWTDSFSDLQKPLSFSFRGRSLILFLGRACRNEGAQSRLIDI